MGTYQVEYIPYTGSPPVPVDISTYVHSIDYVRLFSDGRINTASLTLNASFGKFITTDSGGATPILSNFDRIRITGTDGNGNSYSHIFEIINDLSQLNRQSEYLLPLTLEGRERNLSLIPFSGYFDPHTHYDMVEDILETYFITKGTIQPVIETTGHFAEDTNFLPKYNPNIWDFQYIDNCLDAIQVVVRLANQSVAAGGGGDRFAIIFEDSAVLDQMVLKIIPQGYNNFGSTYPIIRANELTNPITVIAKVKQPPTGTIVIARGKPGSGGVPVSGDQYAARLEFYQRIQARQSWSATISYEEDALTSFNNQVYQATATNINDQPPSANWATLSAGQYIGNIQYSPFTIDKAALFKNECTNPTAAFASESESSPKMLDCNIVIDDEETQRDWVWLRKVTDNVASWSANEKAYLFKGTSLYEGFRILVDVSNLGAASGSFDATLNAFGTGAGKDPNGRPYANNACVYIDGKWYVMKEHDDFDQILVRYEGLFEWNVNFAAKSQYPASDTNNANRRYRQASSGTPNAWRSLNEQFLSNDCLHSPTSITNVTGLIDPVAKDGGGFYTDNSAVRIIYEYSSKAEMPEWRKVLDQLMGIAAIATGFLGSFALSATSTLYDLFLTPYYRNVGWWITISAPFPFSTHNGITEQVGQLYGAGTANDVSILNQHSTFDAYNQTATFTGKRGWAEDDSSGMMEITGVTFLFKLDIQANGVTIPFTGDIKASYWAIDDNGTIWKSTKPYRHLNDVQRMTFDFGDFSPVYRARTPFGINNIVTNILVPELEIRERLFPNRIRIQGFQLEAAYDDKGRYMPNLWENVVKPTIFTMFDPTTIVTNVKFIGDIDYFQWIKTPIAISGNTNSTRIIVPEIKDYPNISNIEQLQRAADADVDVETFQYEQYEITRNNKADISLQDTVYLYEQYMVPEAEAPRPASAPAWNSGTTYAVDDLVSSVGIIYICLAVNTNKIPASNPAFWLALSDPILNTRELTVGEIQFSVTNGKDMQFQHTLIKRIPRVT